MHLPRTRGGDRALRPQVAVAIRDGADAAEASVGANLALNRARLDQVLSVRKAALESRWSYEALPPRES